MIEAVPRRLVMVALVLLTVEYLGEADYVLLNEALPVKF